MPELERPLSESLKQMAETLFRDPRLVPSSEAAHVALFFANAAWNESLGLGGPRQGYHRVWQTIAAQRPSLWDELKSTDVDRLIDELVAYKKTHFPDDRRRILTCGIPDGKVRVEWLPPAAAGVDARWEMRLYGLVRAGQAKQAALFLKQTRRLSRAAAEQRVRQIAAELGMR